MDGDRTVMRRIVCHKGSWGPTEIYVLECGHGHAIARTEVYSLRLFGTTPVGFMVECQTCKERSSRIPDTVSECFPQQGDIY